MTEYRASERAQGVWTIAGSVVVGYGLVILLINSLPPTNSESHLVNNSSLPWAPGTTPVGPSYAGLTTVPKTLAYEAKLFYWFFPCSRNPRVPLVITPEKRKRSDQEEEFVNKTDSAGPSSRRNNGKEATSSSSHASTHQQIRLVRIDTVIFGPFEIKPWFSSPYMLEDTDMPELDGTNLKTFSNGQKRPTTKLTGMKRLGNGRFIKKKKPKAPPKTLAPALTPRSGEVSCPRSEAQLNEHKIPSSCLPNHVQGGARRSSESLSSLSSSIDSDNQSELLRSNQSSSNSNQPPTSSLHTPQKPRLNLNRQQGEFNPVKLFVCDGCFQYLLSSESYLRHKNLCLHKHPPGRKVYQRGAHIIWKVDGSEAKLYCQCLCLFGKLFIDHKYIFFDVEGFQFYILTAATSPAFDHVLAFFSKEKVSYDGYNLACIMTFPPYQKKGYGTLLIKFSYELDRYEAGEEDRLVIGTPERPLSESGARGCLAFWTAVLVRYFRKLFEEERSKRSGSVTCNGSYGTPTRSNASQASSPHPSISIEMKLEEISRETQLRPDDAAFALFTSGFTQIKTEGPHCSEVVVITPELVEKIAQHSRTKPAVLDRRYVLLGHSS